MVFKTKLKDPGETLDFKFDWGIPTDPDQYLEPGETISLAVVDIPDGLVYESHAIVDASRSVLFWVSGGTLGTTYGVVCTITTNTSRTAVRTMPILIQKK